MDDLATDLMATALLPSGTLGKYALRRKLGEGGMGVVYLATDTVLNRPVAIKMLKLDALAQSGLDVGEITSRFRAEASAAAKLNSPNIVRIFDFGVEAGTMYIVMEYLEGRSLDEIIRDDAPLPEAVVRPIVRDIANALDQTHRAGIVHRDLKPSNVMVLSDGRAVLMDFGIARLEDGTVTRTGAILGTPNYMSPEQVTGSKAIDGRSDLFALGAVAHEMLTGERAFSGRTFTAITYRIVNEPSTPVERINPSVGRRWGALVSRCLEKDPKDRFSSARDLLAELGPAGAFDPPSEHLEGDLVHLQKVRQEIGRLSIMDGDVLFTLEVITLHFAHFWVCMFVFPRFVERLAGPLIKTLTVEQTNRLKEAKFWRSPILIAISVVCHTLVWGAYGSLLWYALMAEPVRVVFWFEQNHPYLLTAIIAGYLGLLFWYWAAARRIEVFVETTYRLEVWQSLPHHELRSDDRVSGLLRNIIETSFVIVGNALAVYLATRLVMSYHELRTTQDEQYVIAAVSGALVLIILSGIQYSCNTRSIELALLFQARLGPWNRKARNVARFLNGILLIPVIVVLSHYSGRLG